MKWVGGLLLFVATISFADVTVTPPPVTGSNLPAGSTQYIQNALTPTTTSQIFSIQEGTFTWSATTPKVIFSQHSSVLQSDDNTALMSYQGSFNMYGGHACPTSTAGGFNACWGEQCMTPFNGGSFSYCGGPFCMATGAGFAGQQDGCNGYACMAFTTDGSFNNCNGGSCLLNCNHCSNNVCNGVACMRDTTADNNACDGEGCFQFNATGTRGWGLGTHAGAPFSVLLSTNQVAQNDMGYLGYETSPGDLGLARGVAMGNLAVVSSSDTLAMRFSNLSLVQSTAPVATSCGTNPAVVGTNSAFTVTVGATTTGCTMTFSQYWPNAPVCMVSERTGSVVNALSYTVGATGMTFSQTALGGNVIDVICMGRK